MSTNDSLFHWLDYLVFSAVLFISTAIGIFSAVRHGKSTSEEMLLGSRKLPLLPVALSLAASFMSAIFVLGSPAEAYFNGTEFWYIGISYIPAQLITVVFIMPIFYSLRLTSAYQYLEMRFCRTIQILGSLTFIFEMVLYLAVVMYTPALALSQVTQLPMEVTILATGLVCTFYTSLGGIKAVVWTDTFQMLVIFTGFIVVIVSGTITVGGWGVIWAKAFEGKRFTNDIDWNPDPFERHTFWSLTIGGTITSLGLYGANQALLQRYLSVRSVSVARWAIVLHLPLTELFLALAMITGLVMFAFYEGCDPLLQGRIASRDQLLALFVMDTSKGIPGFAGVFVACVFSAALSTVSSGVNSLAAVTLEDFIKPWLEHKSSTNYSQSVYYVITIVIALFYGGITIGLAYTARVMGNMVLQIVLSIFGIVGGPLLGLVLAGMFLPCVNSLGAGTGLFVSLALVFWIALGSIIFPHDSQSTTLPPLTTLKCSNSSHVITDATVSTVTETGNFLLDTFYRLSYQHYSTLALLTFLAVSVFVSVLTGCNKKRRIDRRLYYDIFGWFRRIFTGTMHQAGGGSEVTLDGQLSSKCDDAMSCADIDVYSTKL